MMDRGVVRINLRGGGVQNFFVIKIQFLCTAEWGNFKRYEQGRRYVGALGGQPRGATRI